MSMRPGPKPTPGITAGMYFDYCLGMSVDEVATKWSVLHQAVYNRFNRMGLPLRSRRGPRCTCRARNPHKVIGLNFTEANRERTRIASRAVCARAEAALPNTKSPRAQRILQLRIDHPDATLAELAALHDPPLTKDTLSAVLRRATAKAAAR